METAYKEITETVKPPALRIGDDIRIVAPASAPDMKNLSRSINRLNKLGFKISLGRNIRKLVQRNSLAAPADERTHELMDAFTDDSVKAILCARGGYGSIHILPHLDYDVIREHPKILIGYSDITALHMAINKLSGLVTFHGPMPASDPDEYGKPLFKTFLDVLSGNSLDVSRFIDRVIKYIYKGKVEGKSIGTNISVASSLTGTQYMPSPNNKIMFAEDTGITSGDLDRYFSVMKLSAMIGNFVGFAFGEFRQITDAEEPMPYIEDIVQQYINELQKPSIYGLPFGHGEDQMLIPLNARMTLSSDSPYIELMENVVD
ncbi:MAG: LD-carboxypeptidase [Candidatus Thermoplasmatota archaeon]|nr:LD-carboxypeptidase [Candidatus Thermoplasmatota archaeon]